MAAVLACGTEACLSGRAAAHLLGLLKGEAPPSEVSTGLKRRVCGVKVRRARIDRADRMVHRGIPVTTVPRTLTDLAADLSVDALARACHEAGVRYGTTPRHLAAALDRRPRNLPGAAKLHRVIQGDAPALLSALERRFLELLRENALPLPRTNRPAGAYRVDCRWPDTGLKSFAATSGRTSPRSRTRRSPTSARSSSPARQCRRRGEKVGPHDYPDQATCKCS
jgi:hypothetical protein